MRAMLALIPPRPLELPGRSRSRYCLLSSAREVVPLEDGRGGLGRGLLLLRCVVCGRARRGLVDVAVARAHDEVRALDSNPYLPPLGRLRLPRRVVAEAVLTPKLFGDVRESLLDVAEVGRVEVTPAGALREPTQVLAAA